jgi:hypothetical protein
MQRRARRVRQAERQRCFAGSTVCAFVPNADLVAQLPEAKNCIEVVYLFTAD